MFGNTKIIKFYHGDDNEYDEDSGLFNKEIKWIDLKDTIKSWGSADVLIYTSTICAGVDFNIEHFDKLIGIFNNNCAPANYFVQSLLWCWKFKQTTHELYLSNTYLVDGHTNSLRTFNYMNVMENKSVYQLFK